MSVYLISYDLKGADWDDYADLHKEIESFGESIKILESTFLVDTALKAKTMSDRMRAVYQPQKFFIHELKKGSDRQGYINPNHWEWIRARL